jgi:osmotically-inducible protein OsmY
MRKGVTLLVGMPEMTRVVAEALSSLPVTLTQHEQSISALDRVDGAARAVVLVDPVPKMPAWRACQLFRNGLQMAGCPVFVVVPEGHEQNRLRRLYREGALAVFEWPREKHDMAQLMAGMMDLEPLQGRETEEDRSLAQAVRNRIRAAATEWGKPIRVGVKGAVVTVTGLTDMLWKKHSLEELVSEVPGVTGANTRGLVVRTHGVGDQEIARRVSCLMEELTALDSTTLAFSVENGEVAVAGNVGSRAETRALFDVLTHVRGVTGIKDRSTVCPKKKDRDARIVGRVVPALRTFWPDADMQATSLSGVVVLSGSVRSLKQKQQADTIAASQAGVQRVVNKLRVAIPED